MQRPEVDVVRVKFWGKVGWSLGSGMVGQEVSGEVGRQALPKDYVSSIT